MANLSVASSLFWRVFRKKRLFWWGLLPIHASGWKFRIEESALTDGLLQNSCLISDSFCRNIHGGTSTNTETFAIKQLRNPRSSPDPRRSGRRAPDVITVDINQAMYRERLFAYIRSDPKFILSVDRGSRTYDKHLIQNEELGNHNKEYSSTDTDGLSDRLSSSTKTLTMDEAIIFADKFYELSEMDRRVPEYHKVFLEKLRHGHDNVTVPQALQSLLYCAVYRKVTVEVEEKIRRVLINGVNQLTIQDCELVAFSAYILKISFQNDSAFLGIVSDALLSSSCNLAVTVTILKFLRRNNYTSIEFYEKLLAKLSSMDLHTGNGVECCHILQAFSSARFYDEKLFGLLQRRILEELSSQTDLYETFSPEQLSVMHPSKRFRTKDLANYLHSLAIMDENILGIPFIFEELKRRLTEFAIRPYFLVQALHALSMQGHYDNDLLRRIFTMEVWKKLSQEGWKDAQRWLYCLYKNCQIEHPTGIQKVEVDEERLSMGLSKDFYKIGYEMAERNEQNIQSVRMELEKEYGKEAIWWGRHLPHIEVSGFVVNIVESGDIVEMLKNKGKLSSTTRQSKRFAVEIVDNCVKCANLARVLGVLTQKERLLKSLGMSMKKILP